MNILVIRHGESEADLLNVIEGRADFELTERGVRQAKAMADWVKNRFKISKIIASPLKRAKKTAYYLSEATGVPVVHDESLMEFQNGLIAGLSREEADKKYPKPNFRYPHTKVYEMESDLEFRFRAETILSKIIYENDKDSTIAIVAHGGMINMLYRSFLNLPNNSNVYFSTGDTGIHRWYIDRNSSVEKRYIIFSNSLEHLDF
jgi:2,3-bisphosphoglycerate-dependent phosphoglycerate mutase